MGAVTDALLTAALSAGADVRTEAQVTAVEADEAGTQTTYTTHDGEHSVDSRLVLSGVAPAVLDDLLGRAPATPRPAGSQLKLNLLVRRLPRWRSGVNPRQAFAGTVHVAEDFSQLEAAYGAAAGGRLPDPMPGELYCHTLTDPSILAPDLAEQGYQTLTYFGVHTPAGLFANDGTASEQAVDRALARWTLTWRSRSATASPPTPTAGRAWR